MNALDVISAFGHPLIKCTHDTTIELTKNSFLTEKGNCILGINASKACFDLNNTLKEKIKLGNVIKVTVKVDELIETFIGYGNRKLTLNSRKDIVFRRSNYTCDRTILISCTKSSHDLNRKLIEKLNNSNKKFTIAFQVINLDEDLNEI
jgi:hypothetical protein